MIPEQLLDSKTIISSNIVSAENEIKDLTNKKNELEQRISEFNILLKAYNSKIAQYKKDLVKIGGANV